MAHVLVNQNKLVHELYLMELTSLQQAAFLSLEQEVARILDGFGALASNKISPRLVKIDGLKRGVQSLKNSMANKGYNLAINHVEELFHFPVSHICFTNGTLRMFIHVPAYKDENMLQLFR